MEVNSENNRVGDYVVKWYGKLMKMGVDGLGIDNKNVKGRSKVLGMIKGKDMERLSVLKEGWGRGMYGCGGCNGVMMMRRKKGGGGERGRVRYNGDVRL